MISTAMQAEMLHARSISSTVVGRGTISVPRMATSPTARIVLLCLVSELFIRPSGPVWLDVLDGSDAMNTRQLLVTSVSVML